MTVAIGLGFDVHPFEEGKPLVLGGVRLDGPGLAGHSDGDVITHALADALLGAARMDDLGTLFPDSDERYRGASSIQLLEEVVSLIACAHWRLGNVDVAVAAERPRLAAHIAAMEITISRALEPLLTASEPPSSSAVDDKGHLAIRIKPKRAEGLGTIGRGEGIAVWAVALLER